MKRDVNTKTRLKAGRSEVEVLLIAVDFTDRESNYELYLTLRVYWVTRLTLLITENDYFFLNYQQATCAVMEDQFLTHFLRSWI